MEDFSGFPSNGSGFDDDDEHGKIIRYSLSNLDGSLLMVFSQVRFFSLWITYKATNFLTDSDGEEEDDDVEEQVVIHKKGKRDSRKADDVGKSKKKKKKRVVVEVRFTLPNSF